MDSKTTPTLEQRLIAICQTVRNEALDPAIKEAEATKLYAEKQKEEILRQAEVKAKEIIKEAEKKAHDIRKALETSLNQSARQALDLLKEKIEKTLFNPALDSYIARSMQSEKETANLISAVTSSLQAQGIFGDITVELGQKLSKEKVVQELSREIVSRLKNETITVGTHNWGVIIKIDGKHLMIDVSDTAMKELMSNFLRQEFRKILFSDETTS